MSTSSVTGTSAPDAERPSSALAAHEDLIAALLTADEARLRRLVAQTCHVIGPKGYHLSREEWIQAHVADVYELRSIEQQATSVTDLGSTAVVLGRQESVCVFHGERIEGLFQTLGVWHHSDNPPTWQLVALQYTAVSDAARGAGRTS